MRSSLIALMFFVLSCFTAQYARANHLLADTLTPAYTYAPDERAMKLLASDPVFTEYWTNDITFTYDSVRIADLPESTLIPLLQPGEKFSPTWYGKLSSGYKWRWGRQHHGVDLTLKTGDTIFAAWDGVVRYAQWNKSGYGNCVVIRHRNGLETLYAHLSKIQVTPNQYISSGEPIGLGGNTGRSFGAHLHFEIRYKDFSIDPESIIDYNTRQLKRDTLPFLRASIKGARYGGDINVVPASSTIDSLSVRTNSIDSASSKVVSVQEQEEEAMGDVPEKPIALPEKKKVAPAKKPTRTYTIKKGDTFSSIAKKTGVSIALLKKLNPRQRETKLMPGKLIRIQ